MTQETSHMPLDERARRSARLWAIEATSEGGVPGDEYIDGIIRAYLQTAAADVSGLMAQPCTCHPDDNPPSPCAEKYALSACLAASTLQTLSASNAALEAENERLRVALKQTEYLMTKDSFSAAERLSEGLAHVRQARAALSAPKGGQDHG